MPHENIPPVDWNPTIREAASKIESDKDIAFYMIFTIEERDGVPPVLRLTANNSVSREYIVENMHLIQSEIECEVKRFFQELTCDKSV